MRTRSNCRPGVVVGFFLMCALLAAQSGRAVPTEVQYLTGTDKDHTVLWSFQVSSGRLAGVPTNIPVPSCWEMMGFGTYQYGQNGSVSNAETGFYTNTFTVPSAWAGKKIFLVFEGAFTDTSASINGRSAGPTHRGGFYEFKYDVTTNVVAGAATNVLQVAVRRWSTDAKIVGAEEKGDYWDFGGIYRPVYLEAKPAAYIDGVAAHPQANGQITVAVDLGGISNSCIVRAFVTDTNSAPLGNAFSNSITAGTTSVLLSTLLPPPDPWSAEFPTLYTLTVELLDASGNTIHSVTNSIGFRTISFVTNQGFFVNGRKVTMRGVNRHEVWPDTGRTISRAVCDLDIQLIKDMNLNAVRTSHYPPNRLFLEECDRLGLYVLEEFDSYQFVIDTANGARLIGEMIRRDVNHPCIFAWANGNEGGANPNLDGGSAGSTNYFSLFDLQNRSVVRPQQGSAVFNGVVTDHYEVYNSVTNYLRPGAPNVFMPTEILHGLYDGGSGACLAEFWDVFRTATNSGGLFLWALLDEGITNGQTGAMDVKGQSAPDGIVGPYREKEASYYTCKAVFSPVQAGAPDPATFNGSLPVSNRFDFTDLNQCAFRWQLGWFPDATDPGAVYSSSALTGGLIVGADGGDFAGPALPPGATGSLILPLLPATWTNYDALRLAARDPFGNTLYTWTWPLRTQARIRDRILGAISGSAPALSAGTDSLEIVVTNGPRVFRFSRTNGVINSVTISNQPVSFNNGPRPVAGPAWTVNSVTNCFDGTNYVIAMNDPGSSSNAFRWSLRPDGWLTLTYRYTLTGAQENIGITFDYPSNAITAMNWLGQGPYRVWKNRLAGQEIFTHHKTVNSTWTGQASGYSGWTGTQWTYPEFAGFHGDLYWATVLTTEQPITLATPTPNLYLRVLSPPATDKSQVNPSFPPGAISLLHGISAIGDKFDAAYTIGPSAATNLATGLYTGEVSFYFGPLPSSGTDRDGDGLTDAWELANFGALGLDPLADPDGDGLPLLLENAFDLSPVIPDAGSTRLPHPAPGAAAPVAMAYSIPLAQLDFFDFVPEISPDLQHWFGADAWPALLVIQSNTINAERFFNVEPSLPAWPGNVDSLFLRLRISRRN